MNNLIKILKEKEGGNQLINALVEHKNSMNQ